MTAKILTEARDLLHEAIAKLRSIGHPLADKLHTDATTLEAEAKADAGHVAHDAQQVAEQATTDIKNLGGTTPTT